VTAIRTLLVVLLALSGAGCALFYGQKYETFTTATPLATDEYLVLGFLGGLEPWNSADQGVRKLALELRARNLPGVHIETLEDHRRPLALQLIRNAFDRDRNGALDPNERRSTRLILYGMSFGGAAVVKLASQLKAIDIPVLLTVQVDSVGRGDGLIPSNVTEAANLYQTEGTIIRGERTIRAEDPSKTRIVGNFLFTYRNRKVDLSEIPWYKIIFRRAHAKMNADPEVWNKVRELIVDAISRTRP